MKNLLSVLLFILPIFLIAQGDSQSQSLSNYRVGDTILVRLIPGANAPYMDKYIQEVEVLQGPGKGSLVPMFCDSVGVHNDYSTRIVRVRVGYSFYTIYLCEASSTEQAWYNLIFNMHKKYLKQ